LGGPQSPTPSHLLETPSLRLSPLSLFPPTVLSQLLKLPSEPQSLFCARADAVGKIFGIAGRHVAPAGSPAFDSTVGHVIAEQLNHTASDTRIIANTPRQNPSHHTFDQCLALRQWRGCQCAHGQSEVVVRSALMNFRFSCRLVDHAEIIEQFSDRCDDFWSQRLNCLEAQRLPTSQISATTYSVRTL
jgi:hypothetical protein